MNTDKITTLTGALMGAVIAADIDYPKLMSGDKAEIGKAIGALVVFLHGYFTNKTKA